VAVNSRVGSGVSVGGKSVKVETGVAGSRGASESPIGWNGVGVSEAFGFGVTNTSVGRAAEDVSTHEDRSKPQNIQRAMSFFVIKIFDSEGIVSWRFGTTRSGYALIGILKVLDH
jgi:hypothetical protein